MENKKNSPNILIWLKKLPLGMIIAWVVALVFAIGAFNFLRNFIASMEMVNLPGMAVVDSPKEVLIDDGEPTPEPVVSAPESNLPETWDGASRVTILFLGLDARDLDLDAPRSDTMIAFTIDPMSKTAGMISIPRDMWVDIPEGFGYGKINTAYALGEQYKLPGGGPALAMKTVEKFLGVPIQYYAQVDFHAFEEAIDAMGGLYMCVDKKIRIDPIGPKPKEPFEKGCSIRHGYQILAYARDRKTEEGGDVTRAKHQQEVIMALRDQVLSPENFPQMVKIAPDVYKEAAAGLRTNMSFEDALKLGALATQIDVSQIKRGVINYEMGILDRSPDGLSIMKPIPDQIRILRDDIFTANGALSPQAVGEPAELMQAQYSRVNMLNGAYGIVEATELATRSQVYFASQGMNVVGIGSADKSYDRTTVVLHNADLYTLRYILALVSANSNHQVIFRFDPAAGSDVDIMLGNDWALNNPMP